MRERRASGPGPMVGGFTTLPMVGPELDRMTQWMHNSGAVLVPTTSEWEVQRWRFGGAVLILYRNAREQRKWTCNDYGVLNRLEKAMRQEWREEAQERAKEAASASAAPVPRQRTRTARAPLSGPSGAMDVIEPQDHAVPEVAEPPPDGVTKFGGGFEAQSARMELKRLLCDRQEWRCFYCGAGVALRQTEVSALATFEHVVPRSARGPDNAANLVIACQPCNQHVGAMSVFEKLRYRDTLLLQRHAAEQDDSIPF